MARRRRVGSLEKTTVSLLTLLSLKLISEYHLIYGHHDQQNRNNSVMVRIASTLVLASVYVVAATALIEERLSDAASTIASAVDSPPRRPEDIDYAPSKSESSGSDGTDFSNADDYDPDWGTVVGPFGQCGGDDYDGPTECVKDWTCYDVREGYSQCIPDTSVAIIQSSQQTPEPTTPCSDEPEPTSPCTDEPVSATPCPDEPVPTSPCPDEPASDTPSPVSSQEPDATLTPAPSSTDAPAPTTSEPDTSEPPVTETPPPTTEEPATDAPTTEEPVTTEEPTTGPAPISPEPTTDTPVVTPVDPTPEPTQDAPAVPTEEPAPTTPPPALIGAWQQCGGMDFDQSKAGLECVAGYQCDTINDYYSQCVPRHEPGHVSFWAQCGGEGFSGVTSCTSGSTCTYFNQWYSQCVPEEEA